MLWHRTNDLRAFSAADPGSKGEWLRVNVLETRCRQLGLGPCNRAPMGFGTGQTRSDLGSQRLNEIKSGRIVERSLPEARCRRDQRTRRQWVGDCRSSANRERNHSDQKAQHLAHGIAPSPKRANYNITLYRICCRPKLDSEND